jgi:hypothetical protein
MPTYPHPPLLGVTCSYICKTHIHCTLVHCITHCRQPQKNARLRPFRTRRERHTSGGGPKGPLEESDSVQGADAPRGARGSERRNEGSSLRRLSQDSMGYVETSELLHIFEDSAHLTREGNLGRVGFDTRRCFRSIWFVFWFVGFDTRRCFPWDGRSPMSICRTLRAISLALQGEPAYTGKGGRRARGSRDRFEIQKPSSQGRRHW